jgi:hypothetical protein
MIAKNMAGRTNDDPRKLRTLLARVGEVAREHQLGSVVVGLCARTGQPGFPEFVDFVQASLRVEDGIFRMTRERVVLHLADVDEKTASEVIERLVDQFRAEVPTAADSDFDLRTFLVTPSAEDPTVKELLTSLFSPVGASVH